MNFILWCKNLLDHYNKSNSLLEWALLFCFLLASMMLLLLYFFIATRRAKLDLQTAERTAQAGLTLHQTILLNAPFGIVLIDHMDTIVLTNTALEKLFGYAKEELVDQRIEVLVPHELRENHNKQIAHSLTNTPIKRKMAENRQVFGLSKAGEKIAVEINIVPVEIDNQPFSMAVVVDVRERLESQRAMREQNKYTASQLINANNMSQAILDSANTVIRLKDQLLEDAANQLLNANNIKQAILDSVNTAVISTNREGIVQNFNPEAARITGYLREEVINKKSFATWHDENEIVARAKVLSEELGMTIEPGFETFVAKARTMYAPDQNEWTYIHKDGTRNTVILSVTAIRDSQDQVSAYLALAFDVTEGNLQKREQESKELIRINEELNSFAYIASHDLKSPLRGIDQLATWITQDLGDQLSSETRDHLRLMRGRINRMEMLLDDLLAYSRVGRSIQKISTVDTYALLTDMIDLKATEKNISLTLDQRLPTFETKKAPLELVFRNLINNAIKHHDRVDIKISVSVQIFPDLYAFTVEDDGPGIAPQDHDRIFEIFQTLRSRDEIEGSGIGLAIVKKTLDSVGGKISLESEKKQGCKFHFTWPIKLRT